ncbi:MAG: ATP-dependent Lon protease [Actinomycetota bacterium]|jgi:ATP-dependent Lon protease|nr:ATP-dependent Lon protease [Actinomycetota bacterium]
MSDLQTVALPLLPLATGVVLPNMVVTLALESDEAKAAAEAATSADGRLLLVPRIDGRFAAVGTVASVDQAGELPNGVPALILRGLHRATLGSATASTGTTLWVHADVVEDIAVDTPRLRELVREYKAIVEGIAERRGSRRVAEMVRGITDASALADTAGSWPDLSIERKIQVLETLDVEARLELVSGWAREYLAEMEIAEQIRTDVTEGMEKAQREFLLRQQLAAIRKELGDADDTGDVADDYRAKVSESLMPDGVRATVVKEVDRFERTSEQSPEHGWIRTWLDWMIELPWGVRSDDRLDIAEARAILDADHTGLDDVKERIIEHLAVRKLRAERGLDVSPDGGSGRGSGAILALVGPPGVGKTSLGESVARALDRKFVRVALGGVRDEAEIRGHRRTYVGALPGRIARAMKEAGTMNPVVLLDEVDKLSGDWRGDPSSALLEVLDPAQNHTFRDHYLEVDLDLSDVLFVATANVAETIPGPLLDRMELVRLDGYTEDEKVTIARHHLLGRQLERAGLRVDEISITDGALRTVVADYTREAGVRTLEREVGKLVRKVATRIASGALEAPVVVDTDDVRTYLGRAKFFFEAAERTSTPGVATGLAVTGMGGDVLFIEAASVDPAAEGAGLTLTGQLGDVMKESAEIALSFLRSHSSELDLGLGPVHGRFHVHVPAGAVPKDGPSAGVTMTTALASLLTGRAVRSSVGMTGEVTLQGRVLPIGGVKQKVLAAHRAGLTEVVLPARNGPDLEDVPAAVRDEMTFHLVDDVRDVLAVALEPRS